jgi:hypothetical protein
MKRRGPWDVIHDFSLQGGSSERSVFLVALLLCTILLLVGCGSQPPVLMTQTVPTAGPTTSDRNPPANFTWPIQWTKFDYDLVALRSGASVTGTVENLIGEELNFTTAEGQQRAFQTSDIQFILFSSSRPYNPPQHPASYDRAKDLIFLRTGEAKVTTLSAITKAEVASAAGIFPRDSVLEIVFGSPVTAPPTEVAVNQEPTASPPTASATQPPAPSGTLEPRPPNSDANLAQACTDDKPLGGWIEYSYTRADACTYDGHEIYRFRLDSYSASELVFGASEMNYEFNTDSCTPNNPDNTTGAYQGPPYRTSGTMQVKGDLEFYPLRPELLVDLSNNPAPLKPWSLMVINHTSINGETPRPLELPMYLGYGFLGIFPTCAYGFCVTPTACEGSKDSAVQAECKQHPERYAVIPFTGEQTLSMPTTDVLTNQSVKWAVCCGCGDAAPTTPQPQPPSRPAPTATPNLCQAPTGEQAQLDRLQHLRDDYVKELGKKWTPFKEQMDEAEANIEAYRSTIATCAIADVGKELVNYYAGEKGGEAGEAMVKLIDIMEKLSEGDVSVVLPDNEAWAWTTIQTVISGLGAGSPEAMREKINECSISDFIPSNLRDGALKFVNSTEAQMEMLPEIRLLVGRIHQTELEYWTWQNNYYKACVDFQECKGQDTSICPKPPAAP